MYRARVQAVSGSKVFADGKWLRCIGNKPVSVGERVWTDGRVVYGHYTIPQTPLISIPQDETVIPIVTTKNFYVFTKGKLKIVTPTGITPPTFDKLFICNKRNQAYFVDDNYFFSYGGPVYWETDNWGYRFESETYWTFKGILAANVDKRGDLFGIFIDGENLLIKKNKQTVKEFNLQNLAQAVFGAVAQPANPSIPPDAEPYGSYVWTHDGEIGIDIYHSFIENEKNFNVSICFDATKISAGGQGDTYSNQNIVSRHYYISNNGIEQDADSVISYIRPGWSPGQDGPPGPNYTHDDDELTDWDFITIGYTEFNPDKKYPLQDGYYFKRKLIARQLTEETFTTYERKTVYSPDGTEIFTGLFPRNSNIIFAKVKSGYLMGVINNSYNFYFHRLPYNLQTILGLPFFRDGIFLFSSGNWKLLTEDYSTKEILSYKDMLPDEQCLNQSLIPIKNKKNWPNRIKTISFED